VLQFCLLILPKKYDSHKNCIKISGDPIFFFSKMLRPLSQHSTRARGVHLTSIFPSSSFTQNALFSGSCSGLGRGSMNQVILGGKSISLNKQEINIDPESEVTINAIKVQPGQFNDAVEEKEMFQSLAEPIKDPLKQLYEERQSSSPSLRSKRSINKQQQTSVQGAYKREKDQSKGERGSSFIYKAKQPAQKKRNKNNKNDLDRNLRQTDFVAQDINWSDFINSSANELVLENEEEQEALRLEFEGGDYIRYLSFPKSIQEKFNLDNDIANSLQKIIGQNPSYKLSEKNLIYETLFQNLNKSMQQTNKK
jgi:hypothetical protein